MRIRRTRQAGSPAPLFVFFCPSSLFVFKFVVVRLTDVEYVSNGRNKHPPPKFFRTLRRQRPLGYGTLFLGRVRPTTFFKERRFWVFFWAARLFGYKPKSQCAAKKKPMSTWISFSGHPVYLQLISPRWRSREAQEKTKTVSSRRTRFKKGLKMRLEILSDRTKLLKLAQTEKEIWSRIHRIPPTKPFKKRLNMW